MFLQILLVFLLSMTSTYAKSHHPQDFLKHIHGAPDEGAQIVQHFCASCHAKEPMIQLGAPRIGEISEWQVRLKQGLTLLLKHTEEGYGAMPPRGGCFECSDRQLKQAVEYLLKSINHAE